MERTLAQLRQQWKDEGKTADDIDFMSKNWKLLEGQRIIEPDSFDFILESVGVFSNKDLVKKACSILVDKLKTLDTLLETDELKIVPSLSTMFNCFDIILENEDYTIGKVIEYFLYSKFYEGTKSLSFCGFKKMHPHDKDSIIRVAYKEELDKMAIKQNLKECIADAIDIYKKIQDKF
jgi:DNA-directed RNA polymerase subunit L